jgi:HlyD family secretion protein
MTGLPRVVALLAFVVVACHRAPDDSGGDDTPGAATVACKPVASTTIGDIVTVSGVVAPPPRADSVVSATVAGRIGSIAVDEGDVVAANALIATVEDPSLPAGTIEAKAGVASAQAAKVAADQEVARQERMVASGIGARKDLENAKAAAAAAAAEVQAATARSGLAVSRLDRRELRAPRAGVVLHVWRKVGETVDGTSATPIAEIADVSVLEIHAQVPPVALAKLKADLAATAHVLGNDDPITATVLRVAPAVDPSTLLGLVRIKLTGDAHPPVGVAATADVVVANRPGVSAPATALRRSQVGADEIVVCGAGSGEAQGKTVARVRSVTVGNRGSDAVEITDGLNAGEQVVVDHVLGLVDGQQLVTAP